MRAILLFVNVCVFLWACCGYAESSQATRQEAAKITAVTTSALASASSTQQIENTVHQFLIKKPEVVVEALQAYQQKQMESMQQLFKQTQKLAPQYADVLFHQPGDPMGGNVEGKITLVEFSDYQCTHCIEVAAVIDTIIKANPHVRVVVKEFPIRGPVSEQAARAALAAAKQNKYWAFREALFKVGATIAEEKIYETASAIGLNVEQLKKDMEDKAIYQAIQANQKLAMTLKLVGTPAFFIAKSEVKNGASSDAINYVPGIISQQQLQTLLDKTAK